jgi:predicted MPP superfamily phosphohydrolase
MKLTEYLHNRKGRRMAALFLCAILLAFLAGWMFHANAVPALTEITIPAAGLPAVFDGFRIAQVSDLHNAELGHDHAHTLDLLREAKPDIILLTGDLIDCHRTDVETAVSFVEQAVKIAPCYYVTGNHEGYIPTETYAELEEALLSLEVTVLHGETVTLEKDGEILILAGMDSPDFDAHAVPPAELCGDGFTVLLAHHPEFMADYLTAGADVVFAGHAHGGQFRLPLIGGLYAPGQGLFPAYDDGLYTETDADGHTTHMVVSRGLGNSSFPLRLGNRPEVVLAVLKTK